MDTNKNIGINEFSGGMNADVNYNVIQHNLYTYGENVRISTNSLIGEIESPDKKEGSLVLIPEGVEKEISLITGSDQLGYIDYTKVIAIQQIDNLCIAIIKDPIENDNEHYNWSVYRIDLSDEETIQAKKIFTSGKGLPIDRKISTTINKEVNGIIKLYVADGERQILSINVNEEFDEYNQNLDEDQLVSNSYFPKNKIIIEKVISGKLPVGQVQYTYRFYKKYGIKSKLAPLTNKIQVINSNRNREEGNAEDTDSSIGFLLKIQYSNDCKSLFDKVQVFRIYYKKVDVDADIELIYDEKLPTDGNYMLFNDIGRLPLQEYTAELFSLLDGQDIVPKVIEHNQGYLFAANVKDETRLKLEGFDARAFSANIGGGIVLYNEQDTTYSNNPSIYSFLDNLNTIEPNLTLNKFADVNLSDRSWESVTACRFDAQGYFGGTGPYVSWRFVTTHIPIVSKDDIDKNLAPSIISEDDHQLYYLRILETGGENDEPTEFHIIEEPVGGSSINSMLHDNGINANAKITYNDILTSSCVRSLRRDEVYRYGIVLYDNTGKQSDVNWIADIKTPSANELKMYDLENDTVQFDYEQSESNSIPDKHINMYLNGNVSNPNNTIKRAFRSGSDNDSSYNQTAYEMSFDMETNEPIALSAGQKIHIGNFNPVFDAVSVYRYRSADDANPRGESFGRVSLSELNAGLKNMLDRVANGYDVFGNVIGYADLFDWIDSITGEVSNWKVTWIEDQTSHTVSVDEYNKNYYTDAHNVNVSAEIVFNLNILRPDYKVSIVTTQITGEVTGTSKVIPEQYTYSIPIGILFKVELPSDSLIIGYQIVRCSKDKEYRKNVMLCVSALPIRQQISKDRYSPYYPHYLLTTNGYEIRNRGRATLGNHGIYGEPIRENNGDPVKNKYSYYTVTTDKNPSLFQLYSPEITTRRKDALQEISDCGKIDFFGAVATTSTPRWVHVWNAYGVWENGTRVKKTDSRDFFVFKDVIEEYVKINYNKYIEYDKAAASIVTHYALYIGREDKISDIHSILDGKSPLWENAYGDVQLGGDGEDKVGITSATKQYKGYTTSIASKEYVNWICNAMYDIRAFKNDVNADQHYPGWGIIKYGELYEQYHDDLDEWYEIAYDTKEHIVGDSDTGRGYVTNVTDYLETAHSAGYSLPLRIPSNAGFVGPGPLCFIASTDPVDDLSITNRETFDFTDIWPGLVVDVNINIVGTHLVNIMHDAMQYAGLGNSDKQFDTYYGFGNFHLIDETTKTGSSFVFDGDVYIVPFEIVLMFKTYDFNSSDSLQSALFIYYVALESPINTFFDYGMNFRNTQAKTLQLEPGEISGVASLDRPLSQYNQVLSNNSISNDIYSAKSSEDLTSEFGCRIWFSNHKTSGESMDNWLSFSPLDYLDADSRFGDITCLSSIKDSIYCWQDRSFGKISVNERSLVKDNNSNMIQLGQGGIAQRIDYVDSIHGMSPDLYVCENVANLIYWIDDKNKSIMMSDGTQSVNLSERSNVQSILNREFDNSDLSIGFDLQSDELLCKCLSNGKLIVFNTKLNIATSIYTREYDQLVRIDDKLYGFVNNGYDKLALKKYGGLTHLEVGNMKYMPARVEFIMNENSSITKVFDNQEIVFSNITMTQSDFKSHVKVGFNTNIANSVIPSQAIDATSYEGNIRYAVPRTGNVDYGNRIRGKWLKVSVELDGYVPNSISHVLTKFRQSY